MPSAGVGADLPTRWPADPHAAGVQVDNDSAVAGGLLVALLGFLVWGVAHEWWRNRRRSHAWTTRPDSRSVGGTGLEETDELDLVEDGES